MMGLVHSLAHNTNLSQDSRRVECFSLVYDLLYAIIRHRREEMLHLIPQYFASLATLLDCFYTEAPMQKHADVLFHYKGFACLKDLYPLAPHYAKSITRLLV
ncbi:hypothetical protein HDV03_002061, partial [Kappamyces sp. JEL0829]